MNKKNIWIRFVSNGHDFNLVVSQFSNTCNELNCLRSMVSSYSMCKHTLT